MCIIGLKSKVEFDKKEEVVKTIFAEEVGETVQMATYKQDVSS